MFLRKSQRKLVSRYPKKFVIRYIYKIIIFKICMVLRIIQLLVSKFWQIVYRYHKFNNIYNFSLYDIQNIKLLFCTILFVCSNGCSWIQVDIMAWEKIMQFSLLTFNPYIIQFVYPVGGERMSCRGWKVEIVILPATSFNFFIREYENLV